MRYSPKRLRYKINKIKSSERIPEQSFINFAKFMSHRIFNANPSFHMSLLGQDIDNVFDYDSGTAELSVGSDPAKSIRLTFNSYVDTFSLNDIVQRPTLPQILRWATQVSFGEYSNSNVFLDFDVSSSPLTPFQQIVDTLKIPGKNPIANGIYESIYFADFRGQTLQVGSTVSGVEMPQQIQRTLQAQSIMGTNAQIYSYLNGETIEYSDHHLLEWAPLLLIESQDFTAPTEAIFLIIPQSEDARYTLPPLAIVFNVSFNLTISPF